MTPRNPNGLVRVARLCISRLLIASAVAWVGNDAAATTVARPTVAVVVAKISPDRVRRTAVKRKAPTKVLTTKPASAPSPTRSTLRSSASTPSVEPTSTESTQTLGPSETSSAPAPAFDLLPPPPPPPPPPTVDHRKHAGNYRCDHGRTFRIADVPDQTNVILLSWQGTQHRLERVHSNSGAERFEAPATGLVWILIPAKAMLLNANQGRPLANECRL